MYRKLLGRRVILSLQKIKEEESVKKKIVSLLLVAMMAAGLVACGGNNGNGNKANETSGNETSEAGGEEEADGDEAETEEAGGEEAGGSGDYSDVELTFWSMWANTEPQGKVIQAAVDKFQEETGAKVTIEWKNRDIKNILNSALESKENIDLFEDDYKRIAQNYVDYVADLSDMASAAGYADKSYALFDTQQKAWAKENAGAEKLTSVAEQPQVGGIFYRKDLFEKAGVEVPTTWTEFMDVCKTLKENGIQPLALDTAYASFAFGYHLSRYVPEETIAEMSKEGGWGSNEGVAAAADSMIEFINAGYLADGAPDEWPNSQNKIGMGDDVAMVICANYVTTEVNNTTGVELDWGLFNYPGVEGKDDLAASAYAGANSIAITDYCENKQAAFDLAMMIVTGEFDQQMANDAGQIPADPANTAPASQDGTVEVLKATTSPLAWNMGIGENADLYPKLDECVIQLFEGKFATGADFAKALDGLY